MPKLQADVLQDVLSDLEQEGLDALLAEAQAPVERCERVTLIDLHSHQASALGDSQASVEFAALSQALLDGGEIAELDKIPGLAAGTTLLALRVAGHALVLMPGKRLHVVAVSQTERSSLTGLRQTHRALAERIKAGQLAGAVEQLRGVAAAWRVDPGRGVILESFYRQGDSALHRERLGLPDQGAVEALFASLCPPIDQTTERSCTAARELLDGVLISTPSGYCEASRIPFVGRLAVCVEGIGAAGRPWRIADQLACDALRGLLGRVLATGLKTQLEPFPQSEKQFDAILAEIRALEPDDLIGRLVVGGFVGHPVDAHESNMCCRECIYFLPHRRWCDLPELPLPVESDWYCRLWKM